MLPCFLYVLSYCLEAFGFPCDAHLTVRTLPKQVNFDAFGNFAFSTKWISFSICFSDTGPENLSWVHPLIFSYVHCPRLLEGHFILVLPRTIDSLIMQFGIASYCPLTWITDLNLSFFRCLTTTMGWPCHWTGGLKVTCRRALSLKGRAKGLSDCSLA
jgi:hypothetical protein